MWPMGLLFKIKCLFVQFLHIQYIIDYCTIKLFSDTNFSLFVSCFIFCCVYLLIYIGNTSTYFSFTHFTDEVEERVNFGALYELSKMTGNPSFGKPRYDEDNISIIELDSVTVSTTPAYTRKSYTLCCCFCCFCLFFALLQKICIILKTNPTIEETTEFVVQESSDLEAWAAKERSDMKTTMSSIIHSIILNKSPMGQVAHLRNQFRSINTFAQSYDYIITWREKKSSPF